MGTTLIAAVVIAIVGFFAFMYWVGKIMARDLETLARLACPSCGTAYGKEASLKARDDYKEYCDRVRKERPGARINFAPIWKVRCPGCAVQAQFNFQSGTLE